MRVLKRNLIEEVLKEFANFSNKEEDFKRRELKLDNCIGKIDEVYALPKHNEKINFDGTDWIVYNYTTKGEIILAPEEDDVAFKTLTREQFNKLKNGKE